MKVISETRDVETSGGMDSNVFAIKTSPQAFQLLSSGLYTNKVKAVLRELGCNAVDAHTAAGCPEKPIEVKLPNALDKQFYVKDYGTGLSHEQVMRLYTTYFDSTKQQSDNFIGGFGVGSKSPFAYTDTFTVESRYNGEKRLYTAFVNESGIPTIMQMSEEKTDEPNGLTIGFPVKPEDISNFAREAFDTYKWFSVHPIIKGNADIRFKDLEKVRLGNLWYRTDAGYNSSPTVRMGSVAYPMADLHTHITQIINDDTPEDEKAAIHAARYLFNRNSGWVIDLPIGSSLVAASREALQFDKKSVVSLKNAVTKVINEAVEALHDKVKSAKNIREYHSKVSEFRTSNGLYNDIDSFLNLLSKHNPNYHTDGIRIHASDYPALKLVNIRPLSGIRDLLGTLRHKAKLNSALDADEIQRRIRRKITASFNENGKEADYEAVEKILWDKDGKQIQVWPHEYSYDSLAEVSDFSVATTMEFDGCSTVIARTPGATDADFKRDLKKLTDFLDIKTTTLQRPVKPPPKKVIKTEDIYGVRINKGHRQGDITKLSRQRMVTSEITSKIEEDDNYAYVVFDKKALPNTPHAPLTVFDAAMNKIDKLNTMMKAECIKDVIKEHIPEDRFVMVEKSDLDTFKKLCPDAVPLDSVISSIKKDKSIHKTLIAEVAKLPSNVSYSSDVNNFIRFYDAMHENDVNIEHTKLHEVVSKWKEQMDESNNSRVKREHLVNALIYGESLFDWPKPVFPDTVDLSKESAVLRKAYPMLEMISYYNANNEAVAKYILDMAELDMYRNNAYNVTSTMNP